MDRGAPSVARMREHHDCQRNAGVTVSAALDSERREDESDRENARAESEYVAGEPRAGQPPTAALKQTSPLPAIARQSEL